jgi:prophage regulatory protein
VSGGVITALRGGIIWSHLFEQSKAIQLRTLASEMPQMAREASNILREPQVLKKTGWSHSTLWEKVKLGLLPAPIKLDPNGRAVGWLEDWIVDLQEKAIARAKAGENAAVEAASAA